VEVVAGDYTLGQLERVVTRAPLLADVVTTWMQRASDRRTVVYGVSIAHAVALAEAFRRVGVAAEHVDAKTPAPERAATFARFRGGTTQVLTNCFLAALGFDLPVLSCIVLARPTQSLMLYLQMLGRGLRIADGKTDCLVLDHSGVVHRFGFATDPRQWQLTGTTALAPPASRVTPPRSAKTCPECHAVWLEGPICPECGYVLRPKGRLVDTLEGDLVELGTPAREEIDRRAFYAELRGLMAQRNYKPGFAKAKFRERFKTWPVWGWDGDDPVPPSLDTIGWVLSRQIAWRKSGGRVA
jgi:superfamily II DNA or RNA helicase